MNDTTTMPMTTCWSTIDSHVLESEHVSLSEIFGDELLDIYQADTREISNAVQETKSSFQDENNGKIVDSDEIHSMNLKSSTSMNEFTSILENSNAALPSITDAIPLQEEKSSKPVDTIQTEPLHSIITPSIIQERKRHREVDSSPDKRIKLTPQTPATKKKKKLPKTGAGKPKLSNAASPPPSSQNKIPTDAANVVPTKSMSKTEGQSEKNSAQPSQVDSRNSGTDCTRNAPPSVRAATPVTVSAPGNPPPKPTVVTPVVTNPQVVKTPPKDLPPLESNGNNPIGDCESKSVEKPSPKSNECFKDIAKAAVANLMVNARSQGDENGNSNGAVPRRPVNTSTSHVKALTSDSWVAACAASIGTASPGTAQAAQAAAFAASTAAFKAASNLRAKRASLTAEDRAKQARDRNREHARNTRLRKKAYVEELKRTLAELVVQRDAMEIERRNDMQREIETRDVRFKVMNEFLRLRSRGSDQNMLTRWAAILGEGFTCTLPQITKAADPLTHVLHGPDQCFRDACEFEAFMHRAFQGSDALVITFQCDRANFMMDNIKTMMSWTLTVSPTKAEYDGPKFSLKGFMRASFIPSSNKLSNAELIFDTQNVKSQIQSIIQSHQQSIFSIPPVTTVQTSSSINNNGSNSTASGVSLDTISPLVSLPPFYSTSTSVPLSTTATAITNNNTPSPAPSLVSAESTPKDIKLDCEGTDNKEQM